MKKRSIIFAIFLALFMIAFLATTQVGAQVSKAKKPSPPPPDPVMDKLNLILEKLEQLPPTWSQKLPGTERFVLVMDDLAVLDKETGLVWQRQIPDIGLALPSAHFYDAQAICHTALTSGRYGWRLPTIEELLSITDPVSVGHLFPGNPFIMDRTSPAIFWTATTIINDLIPVERGKAVDFDQMLVYYDTKDTIHRIWCVRGGYGYNGLK